MRAEKPTGGVDLDPVPAGIHNVVCSVLADLGTQTFNGQYGHKEARKILLGFDVPALRATIEGVDLPRRLNERFTFSFHEKAGLLHFLEAWRGRQFTAEEIDGQFDTKNLLGVPAQVQVFHKQSQQGRTFANIVNIFPSQLKRDQWPQVEGGPIYLNLQEFDPVQFERLGKYWQGQIMISQEWPRIVAQYPHLAHQDHGQGQPQGGGYGQPQGQPQGGGYGQPQGGGYGQPQGQPQGQPVHNRPAQGFQPNPPQGGGFGGGQDFSNPQGGGNQGQPQGQPQQHSNDPGPQGNQDQSRGSYDPNLDDEIPF